MPNNLLIMNQNPLTLLHKALSQGLHASSDEECMDVANNIRIVLTELADRIGQLLREQTELENAVKRLLKP